MSKLYRLLFIDDEEIVLKSCLKILKDRGYDIETAHSGEEGLGKISNHHYDLVVTDLKMPGIDGIEVLRRIKTKDPTQLVVVFTGFATVETARESLKMGAFDYIPKPFTATELRDVVANALRSLENEQEVKMIDLMAIVAHEFKSPVAAVQTTADTLYGGYFGQLTPDQRKGLETIMRNCQYLEDIIRCYVDLSKMELGNLEFKETSIDLVKDVVAATVDKPEYAKNLKRMRLQATYDDVPPVSGDANLLRIVVNNLVNNAIKYGRAETDIRVKVYQQDGQVLISVFNEGPGIETTDIETRLFKRFERLKQSGTEGVKGSGLGLYICKKIVDQHRGKIEVVSEFGRFVEFKVRLNSVHP
ncbi:MAG: response regulator [Proteobacteria bacterium]|nr:response regulator [Pseudomonadota bacterium]